MGRSESTIHVSLQLIQKGLLQICIQSLKRRKSFFHSKSILISKSSWINNHRVWPRKRRSMSFLFPLDLIECKEDQLTRSLIFERSTRCTARKHHEIMQMRSKPTFSTRACREMERSSQICSSLSKAFSDARVRLQLEPLD